MVDLTPYAAEIDAARRNLRDIYDGDPRTGALAELAAAGFESPSVLDVNPTRPQRIMGPGDKGNKKSGWCVYSEFEDSAHPGRCLGILTYGSWRGFPDKVTWSSRSLNQMTVDQRFKFQAQIERDRALKEAAQREVWAETAKRAFHIWDKAQPAPDSHPYLARKGVKSFDGVRLSRGDLVIPITLDGAITSLQFIKSEGVFEHTGENKSMLSGGRKKGCYFKIDGLNKGTIYIAEGYATAASIAMATAAICYVAFDAGNLYEVAAHVKQAHSGCHIVIAGDDDQKTDGNPGRTKAMQAAQALSIDCIFPPQPGDFNDFMQNSGLQALKNYLKPSIETYGGAKSEEKINKDTADAPGILGAIINYYNATSGNKQPDFAVQTAIAICSIVCARNYETNLSNRTSLFLLNIGKSGTGKEHAKKVIEKILDASNMGHLISGSGYTSGSAVFSALQRRPRHLTIIDEFSKHLQAAQNKYGSSHLMEANKQLMEVIAGPDGVIRPKEFSTIGLTSDKRKELSDMKVINPAVTMVAMSTPDDLFETIDIRSIKDGFINRFVICISDAERSLREHKEPLDVPQSILDWIARIYVRAKADNENAVDAPMMQTLPFSIDALKIQREFDQFCIDKANELESLGMSAIPGRSAEMAMRLALITALACDPYAETISADHMTWAVFWIKKNLLNLIGHLKMSISSSEHEGNKKEILKAIRQAGSDGVTWSNMQKRPPYSKFKPKDLKEILSALKDADLISEEGYSDGGRGRPTTIYRALA